MESSSDLYEALLVRMLKKTFLDSQPADTLQIEIQSAVPKGENYTSDVKRVKIKMITVGGTRKTFSMIVKQSKPNLKDVLQDYTVFKGETKAYTGILRQMASLMVEFDDKRENLWAEFYGFEPYSLIALEDLKERNFTVMDRTSWLSIDHSLLVLRCLGRFHAMGKILVGRNLICEKDEGKFWVHKDSIVKDKLVVGCMHMLSKTMQEKSGSWKFDSDLLGKRIKEQEQTISQNLEQLILNYDKKFEVLNHGDLWTSNIMFKLMEYTDSPINIKFVDYQMMHINSFIWDVTYFMHTSIVPSVRRANYDILLEAYHQSLSKNLEFFKWEGYIPSLEDVKSEAKRTLPFSLACIASIMPITSATTNDSFRLDKLMTHKPEEVYSEVIFNEEKYVREIGPDLENFAKLGII